MLSDPLLTTYPFLSLVAFVSAGPMAMPTLHFFVVFLYLGTWLFLSRHACRGRTQCFRTSFFLPSLLFRRPFPPFLNLLSLLEITAQGAFLGGRMAFFSACLIFQFIGFRPGAVRMEAATEDGVRPFVFLRKPSPYPRLAFLSRSTVLVRFRRWRPLWATRCWCVSRKSSQASGRLWPDDPDVVFSPPTFLF